MNDKKDEFMGLIKNHLEEKGEKAAEAVKRFGRIEVDILPPLTEWDSSPPK